MLRRLLGLFRRKPRATNRRTNNGARTAVNRRPNALRGIVTAKRVGHAWRARARNTIRKRPQENGNRTNPNNLRVQMEVFDRLRKAGYDNALAWNRARQYTKKRNNVMVAI